MNALSTGLALGHFLALGAALFCIAVAGIFLNRKNVIVLLMCIELMLLAVNINFVAFSRHLGDAAGQVFVFFILTVAAASRGRDRLGDPGHPVPQPAFDRRRRYRFIEGLRRCRTSTCPTTAS